MSYLNCDSLSSTIQAILLYLTMAKPFDDQELEKIRTQCLDLLTDLSSNKINMGKGLLALNEILDQLGPKFKTKNINTLLIPDLLEE